MSTLGRTAPAEKPKRGRGIFGSTFYVSATKEERRAAGTWFVERSSGYGSHYYAVCVAKSHGHDVVAKVSEQWMADAILKEHAQ